jgi:hypothetical protein
LAERQNASYNMQQSQDSKDKSQDSKDMSMNVTFLIVFMSGH